MPIEVKNLSHVYAQGSPFQSAAVQDVSFTLGEGELVGLIGHTGSGKSTLVQHLNGLVKPTSGTVLVDGMDLWAKGTDLRAVRKKVGLVFQYPEYQLFEETVLKDIAFGPRNLGLSGPRAQEQAQEAAGQWACPRRCWSAPPSTCPATQKRQGSHHFPGCWPCIPAPDPGQACRGAGPHRAAGNAGPAQGAPQLPGGVR